MKESKIIIYISIVFLVILFPIMFFLYVSKCEIAANIVSNIICGFVVSFVTGFVQYFVNKNRIKYEVYGLYYDIYYTYYCTKRGKVLFHYNSRNFYKKVAENNVKISSLLEEYTGFFHKKDKLYTKMNPQFNERHLATKIKKSYVKIFNAKLFDESTEAYIKCVKNILKDINKEKFEKDFANSKKLYEDLF